MQKDLCVSIGFFHAKGTETLEYNYVYIEQYIGEKLTYTTSHCTNNLQYRENVEE